ncbi:shikimate dehydrogenase [Reyranella sp.]|uniref:shikimate dehydrogenase n=1 Tax=Reyranella sp. TaxID=1929291 RepID=UPI003BA98EE8
MAGTPPRSTDRMLVGLIGRDIGGSLSPALHEDAFAVVGMAGHYHLMDAAVLGRGLEELLAAARTAGFGGVNVTFPFKERVIALLDSVSPEAAEIGAVNTVTIDRDGRTCGYNTDRLGFRGAFRQRFGPDAAQGRRALLVGAGGAGRAVAFALMDLGVAALALHDVDGPRAERLCADLSRTAGSGRCRPVEDPASLLGEADIVVNATPIGMTGHEGLPMPTAGLAARHVVADVIYSPLETAFLAAARATGARTMGGAGMCVHQAAEAFRLFTGRDADLARMEETFAAAARRRDRAA